MVSVSKSSARGLKRVVGMVGIGALACVALVGCSSSDANVEKESIDTFESELRLTTPRYLGQIESGETKTNYYFNPPRYRAFGFYAKGGDEITADVKSVDGDAMGWLTTSSYDVVASNDDATRSTLDSKVVYTVPAGAARRAYRIVFRDYDLIDATFSVKVVIKSAQTTCTYGGKTYQQGDTFNADDDCNTCTCGSGGVVGCTKRACICNPDAEPWRTYVGNPAKCMTIRYTCRANQRSFQNACGCGCENLTR